MTTTDVIELYKLFQENGITVWIDGGWGVDALLEKQTRPHKDLDVAIQEKDLPKFRELLEARNYKDIKLEEARPHNFVLADYKEHEIDVHVLVLDEKGNGVYGPPEDGQIYPASSLAGEGRIDGIEVNCISAEDMVKFHSGYELNEKDYKDISALCEKFGIPLPEEYKKFRPSL
ncbi:tRNA nucleotidyltransferase [Candidatus Daviesbacteria bacterium RIFCSPLOWO2_02_FULL_40_8]|nr:MAG: tRNA nucleotidyltransferase [Candidatus Daviesbacteria bacterium RIFCSPHIGHO2_02_FULL_41_14]OGE66994.1 MAG: tRNA nucleotidyltransferase [Candidatus Daviesbacteria bacterium RIFCSPLOWO2_02_FULL_40_8]